MKSTLYLTQCFLLDLPDSGVDCAYLNDNDTNCIQCQSVARFLAGGTINDYYGGGMLTCLFLSILTILVGLSAMVMSYVIITVLRRQSRRTSFETLLTVLAYVDMFCGCAQAVCALCIIIYSRNWSRNMAATTAYMYALMFAVLGRSSSSFLTVAIALERYLMIAFPLKTRNWFTPRNAKILAGVALLLSFVLSTVPRVSSQYVGVNTFKDVKSVSELDYLIYQTPFAKFWYVDLKGSTRIDYVLPLPLLLALNGLIFYHIRKFSLQRKELLTTMLKKDLSAGQMFLPVVTILILCNIPPIIFAYFQHHQQILYSELGIGIFLSAAINSAANLPIYYLKAPGFKEQSRAVLRMWFPCLCKPPKVAESVWCEVGATNSIQSIQTDDPCRPSSAEVEASQCSETQWDNVNIL